ncbi:hypothetical protein Pmani_039399 [Petrolisthes manimaculis]|uniref:Uncharacterized protein n=1 Tax=Petrolisthes manimaculis TaxID=1843537 RepID=A0AAE1NDR8_9EUCA|nr:hypothetical protein Pmani_039399 [Petrolisthes manimaculis]
MVQGIFMCGTFVTMKVAISLGVLGSLTLIIGAITTGIGANEDCYYYDDYNWSWCNNRRTSILISGITCIVLGALVMYLKIRKAPEQRPMLPHNHGVTVVTQPYLQRGNTTFLATTNTPQYPAQYQYPYPQQQLQQQQQQQQQQYIPYPQHQHPPPPPVYSP